MLRKFARQGRDIVAAALRSLPVSSRIAGPPKGSHSSFTDYTQTVRDPIAREWPILAPESVNLSPPVSLRSEALAMFRPLNHHSPGFSLFCISRGRFHRDARTVLTSDDRILVPFSAFMGSRPADNWLFRKLSLGRLTRVPGKSLLLVGNRNYYHFLIEELPRIWLAREAGFELENFDHILMFSPLHDTQKTVCNRLGIEQAQIVPLEHAAHVECEELYLATMPWNYGPTYLKTVRDFVLGLARSSARPPCNRIYVSRERCTHGKITNEADLMRTLQGHGFEKVTPETLSFDDQVALFGRADIIIGAHGAGLTDLVFSRPGCAVIEIRNPTFSETETYQSRGGNLFWRFSQFLNFEYYAFFAQPNQTEHRAPDGQFVETVRLPNMSINIDGFMQVLDPILQQRGASSVLSPK
jgi:hypothetical protein